MSTIVTKNDIAQAVKDLGIQPGDVVLVHSSLKSLGYVEGGPAAVIAGFESVLGKEGTLVMPTLCQVDFYNSYKTWYMDKPSDVGYLTEFFRKQPYVYRSNHATHSVAARGKEAYYLTCEHGDYGPHLCPFGELAFADSSPWLKMYNMGAKIIFLGVNTVYNTMKHVVEARYTEAVLDRVKDAAQREVLRAQVATFGNFTGYEVWPMYNGQKMHDVLDAKGLIRHKMCGNAELMQVDMKQFCDAAYEELAADPESWCNEATKQWLKACKEFW